jgi:uncharacterized protein (DUF58 family)
VPSSAAASEARSEAKPSGVHKRRRAPRAETAWERRLRRWLRPPRTLRPTRAGWVFFALTIGVGLAALNTGNNLMYMVLSLLLSFLVLSGVLSESALRGIQVRRLLPTELVAEQESIVAIEVRNQQRRIPSFAVVVDDVIRVGDMTRTAGRAFALRVAPGSAELRSYRFAPPVRGTLEFVGFRVATRFPFGLFSKALWIEAAREALVFPALDPLSPALPHGGVLRRGDWRSGPAGQSPESAGLRAYAPGDAIRRVHWRASLRRGALLVREQEQECTGETVVRLRTSGASRGPAFEAAVRRAASEVAVNLRSGLRVSLRTDATLFPPAEGPGQRRRLLAHLALVEPASAPAGAASALLAGDA